MTSCMGDRWVLVVAEWVVLVVTRGLFCHGELDASHIAQHFRIQSRIAVSNAVLLILLLTLAMLSAHARVCVYVFMHVDVGVWHPHRWHNG